MLFRRKTDEKKRPRLVLTPGSLQALHESRMLTPTHRRLFGKAMERATHDSQRAQARLLAHDRATVAVIPLAEHDRILSQVGLRRSLTAFCLFGIPLIAVILWAFHHGIWALPVMIVALAGVWACKRLDNHQVGRLELDALEQKALRKLATSDQTSREVFVRWKQTDQPFAQMELQLVEDWLSAQNEVRQWKASERLLSVAPRRIGRHTST